MCTKNEYISTGFFKFSICSINKIDKYLINKLITIKVYSMFQIVNSQNISQNKLVILNINKK